MHMHVGTHSHTFISTECAGISATDIIDGSNIERFQNCTIITSGGIFIGLVPTGPQGAFE